MAFCFCRVLHMILSSPTQFPASLTITRHLGCTHTPGIGIWLTMSYKKEGQAWRESDKAMCAADCWTDYWLVLGKYKLRIPPTRRPQGQKAAAMLNSPTLKSSHDAEVQSSGLEGRLLALPEDGQDNIEERWAAFRDALYRGYCIWKTLTSNPQKSGLVPDRWDWWRHTGYAVRKISTVPSRMAPRHKQGLVPLQTLNKQKAQKKLLAI